jgi:hypothetical protein
MSDDDVIDYLITEAVTFKMLKEQQEAEKKAEVDEWKHDMGSLRERLGQ